MYYVYEHISGPDSGPINLEVWPLGGDYVAIDASREALGEGTFLLFYTLCIKGKCHSHFKEQCPLLAKTS